MLHIVVVVVVVGAFEPHINADESCPDPHTCNDIYIISGNNIV
jgi:hypothetical protein